MAFKFLVFGFRFFIFLCFLPNKHMFAETRSGNDLVIHSTKTLVLMSLEG